MALNINLSFRLASSIDNVSDHDLSHPTESFFSDEALDSLAESFSKDSEEPCLDEILQNDLSLFKQDSDENQTPIWSGEELSYEEVASFFAINQQGNQEAPPTARSFVSKRGKWSKQDLKTLSTHVDGFSQSASKAQNVWESVSIILNRHPADCKARYYRFLDEQKIASRSEESPRKNKRLFNLTDVMNCEAAIKKWKLVREDGLLDIKALSAHVKRGYTSLRYNIYLAKDSVFSSNPFFQPFRDAYQKIHNLKP